MNITKWESMSKIERASNFKLMPTETLISVLPKYAQSRVREELKRLGIKKAILRQKSHLSGYTLEPHRAYYRVTLLPNGLTSAWRPESLGRYCSISNPHVLIAYNNSDCIVTVFAQG